eukprot:3167856-Prymnesium_polylepis.1
MSVAAHSLAAALLRVSHRPPPPRATESVAILYSPVTATLTLAIAIALGTMLLQRARRVRQRPVDASAAAVTVDQPFSGTKASGKPPPHWNNLQGSWVVAHSEGDTDGLLRLMGYPSMVRASLRMLRFGAGISTLDIELNGPFQLTMVNDAGTPLAMANTLDVDATEQDFVGNEGLPGSDKYKVKLWWEGECMKCVRAHARRPHPRLSALSRGSSPPFHAALNEREREREERGGAHKPTQP